MRKLILLSTVLIVFGCEKTSMEPPIEITNRQVNDIAMKYDGIVQSNVDLRMFKMSNHETLIAFFDNDSSFSFKRAFVIASESDLIDSDTNFKNATVVEFRGFLYIQAPMTKSVSFSIQNDFTKSIAEELASYGVRKNSTKYAYGITSARGKWKIDHANWSSELSAHNALEKFSLVERASSSANAKMMGCTSGGEGSTSCSIDEPFGMGGCSVDCSEGYYSCCDSSTVKCTCEKIKHEQ